MYPNLRRVRFKKEKKGGYSTKYVVVDGSGREWVAKLGKEAQSETAANRLLWVAGYSTEVCYLVPRVHIVGKGTFTNVKLEARPPSVKRLGNWRWDRNPFVGTTEFQGLKVMMVLLNNWDIKDSNTERLLVRNRASGKYETHYVMSDLGGTLGKTGNFLTRSRNRPEHFIKAAFIDTVKDQHVDFHYSGKRKSLFRDITVDQARWIGSWLSQVSDRQIRDAFRAANYGPEETKALTQAVRGRIEWLMNLR